MRRAGDKRPVVEELGALVEPRLLELPPFQDEHPDARHPLELQHRPPWVKRVRPPLKRPVAKATWVAVAGQEVEHLHTEGAAARGRREGGLGP